MNNDTINFLSALLFVADDPDNAARPLMGKTVYDFSPAFIAGVEKFTAAFRAYLESTGFPMEKLDNAERGFGGNVYFSLSGHGCGFFDDNDEDVAGLHERLKARAGDHRFEQLDSMIDTDENGKIDLTFIPSAIEEYRAIMFRVPVEVTPDGEKQRCNHCMSVFGEDLTSCPKCGRDDALMHPFEEVKGEDGLLVILEAILAISTGGVIHRNETGKPQWCALDEITKLTNAAIAKAKGVL